MSTITSTPTSSRTASPAPPPSRNRANRAALRDYYNLPPQPSSKASTTPTPQHPEESNNVKHSELDAADFDASTYVKSILASSSLEGVLKVENNLVGEIKSLDGEKKALVYDNYSKLITATDTIRRMRENMGPLTPTSSTLSPTVDQIVETTRDLAEGLKERAAQMSKERNEGSDEAAVAKRRQRETVRWVLGTRRRLEELIQGGKREEAVRDWSEIKGLLEKWKGVGGVGEVREQCEKVMEDI
ncbi:MAG: hypothetical protein Q9217_003247 [Psora testacea]